HRRRAGRRGRWTLAGPVRVRLWQHHLRGRPCVRRHSGFLESQRCARSRVPGERFGVAHAFEPHGHHRQRLHAGASDVGARSHSAPCTRRGRRADNGAVLQGSHSRAATLMHFADFARDVRVARRSLLRSPGVTAAAILSIALGAGSTIAVFAAADAALFRAPPVHDAGRLTILYIERRKPREAATRERWSWARSNMLRSASSFDHVGTFSRAVVTLTGDVPSPVEAEVVSAGYWATLQVSAERGRVFTPSDELGGGVTIVSDDLWRSRFGGDASLLGRTIAVNGQALVVVGIAPRGF